MILTSFILKKMKKKNINKRNQVLEGAGLKLRRACGGYVRG